MHRLACDGLKVVLAVALAASGSTVAGAQAPAAPPAAAPSAPGALMPGGAGRPNMLGRGNQRRRGLERVAAILPRPPAYAHWVIRTEVAEDAKKGKDEKERKELEKWIKPQAIECLKSPTVGRVIVTWEPGLELITWNYKNIHLRKYGKGSDIVVMDFRGEDGTGAEGVNLIAGDMDWTVAYYPGFEWVREEMLVGEVNAYGKQCLLYRDERPAGSVRVARRRAPPPPAEEEPASAGGSAAKPPPAVNGGGDDERTVHVPAQIREAWVTVEGKWPVAERIGDYVNVFQHLRPPEGASFPHIPPEYAAALKNYCTDWGYDVPKL